MLCLFLLYCKVNQLYVYIYPSLFGFPSHLSHHRAHPSVHCIAIYNSQDMGAVAQSRPTLYDPVDCSLPGSSIHGIFQARVLEWVAIP